MAFNLHFHKGANAAQIKNAMNPFQYMVQPDYFLPSVVIDVEDSKKKLEESEEKLENLIIEEGPKGVETKEELPLRITGLYCDN